MQEVFQDGKGLLGEMIGRMVRVRQMENDVSFTAAVKATSWNSWFCWCLWLLQMTAVDVCPPSGLSVEFDMSKPPGSRLSRLDIVCTKCRVPRYEPVQDHEVYTLVLPSYLVAGGDGYSMIAEEMSKHNSGEEEQETREK